MAFFPAPGTAQLVLAGQYANAEQIVSVIHVQKKNDGFGSVWTQQDLRNAAMRLAVAWQRFIPVMTNLVRYQEVRSRDLSSANGAVDLFGTDIQGTAGGGAFPPSVTFLLQWRTGTAGRGANGRTYLPGMVEASADGEGKIVASSVVEYSGYAQGVVNDLGAATSAVLPGPPLDMVVLHKAKGAPATRSGTPVLVGRCSSLVATQRRRLPKRA
jgi:hypothetical protein